MIAPYIVRVTIEHDGGTVTREYVRGPMRLSREAFESFALGDLIRLTEVTPLAWTIEDVTEEDENA